MTPKINILSFAEYVNSPGPGRIGLIAEQRAMYEGKTMGWSFHQPIRNAIRKGHLLGQDEARKLRKGFENWVRSEAVAYSYHWGLAGAA